MRGVSSVAMVVVGVWAGAAQADSKSFERAVPAEPRGVVDISNVSGRIEVIGWDRPEVNVRGELDEGVERVDVTSEHGRTVVKVVLPHTGHHGDAELRVKVPKESEVDVSAVSAEVTTSGVLGEQRLSAVSGDITAEFAGDLEVKTVSGEVKLKGHGQPARLHVSSVSGDVRLEHGAGALPRLSVLSRTARVAAPRRTTRSCLARERHPLARLGVGNHAAADPRRDCRALLPALHGALPGCARARRGPGG